MAGTTGSIMSHHRDSAGVAVIGGGLAGLTAATLLARAGHAVTVFEKAREPGGRAATQPVGDFHFNLGPHALYRGGAGIKILKTLGVQFTAGVPNAAGGYAVDGGVKHTLPGGFVSLVTTSLLRLPAKFELARLLGSIRTIDAQAVEQLTVQEWANRTLRHPQVRALIRALVRLSTYAGDDRQSAGAAIRQLQMAVTSNVYYLNGGWQVLVNGLRDAARASGVRIVTGAKVVSVDHGEEARGVRLADGSVHAATAVVIAASPADAQALVDDGKHSALCAWAGAAIPVKAACLDVGLARLPDPRATFALGVDRPLYLSVHSAVAQLAPQGRAAICVAKYLSASNGSDPKSDERELEGLLDTVHPGWRDYLVQRRFLPNMVVSNALVTAAAGGMAGRPGPAVPGIRNLYVAGDWVGNEGMLADASLASAQAAARLIEHTQTHHAAAAA